MHIPQEWIGHGAHGRYEARSLARRILTMDHRPTAVFAASDTQALGVIAAARELGLHVPEDLAVIGYDDIEAADYVGLTTVGQGLIESGRLGAELLLREMARRSPRAPVVKVQPELIVLDRGLAGGDESKRLLNARVRANAVDAGAH